jgi:deoxyribonuclease-1-like protein
MRLIKLLIVSILLFLPIQSFSQSDTSSLKIVSWNIQNFGKSKSDSTIEYICKIVKDYDIVAIQEVTTSEAGAQAVAKLDACLDRTGTSWDYVISNPTSGAGSERYAYLYKKSRVQLKGKAELEQSVEASINREPYRATFLFKQTEYILFNIHLVPTAKNPQNEIKFLDTIPKIYNNKRLIIMGDFNLSQSHTAYDNLKKSFNPGLKSSKTSLKMKESDEDPLNMEYDNFFVSKNIKIYKSGVILIFKDFKTLRDVRMVSDHCPIYIIIK